MSEDTFPTDEEIYKAFERYNFGLDKPEIVPFLKDGLLKTACGYWNGHSLSTILIKLNLIKSELDEEGETYYTLTSRGTFCCYEWFKRR